MALVNNAVVLCLVFTVAPFALTQVIDDDCAPGYMPTQTGVDWQINSAAHKFKTVWMNVTANTTEAGWSPPEVVAQLFTEDLATSFDYVGDQMPAQCPFKHVKSTPMIERPFAIHSLGAVAQVKFVANESTPYSGIFQGSNYTIARWSQSLAPVYNGQFPGIIPACVLKFFRDGQPSANYFGMYSLNTNNNWNMFGHDVSNHLPDLNASAQANPLTGMVYEAFSTVSDYPIQLGISNLATYDEQGVPANPVRFPFRMFVLNLSSGEVSGESFHPYLTFNNSKQILHPTEELHDMFPSTPPQDQTDDYFVKQLETLSPDTLLYLVYAQDTPTSTEFNQIGEVHLTSKVTGSNWGDRSLFFEHQRLEEDLDLEPQWKDDADAVFAAQRAAPDHNYVYPDLPFDDDE